MSISTSEIARDEIDLWQYVGAVRNDIEDALVRYLPNAPEQSGARGTLFNEALRYALFPGGKRLRPVLTLLGAEIVGGARECVLAAATAIEFVHTSSLIFDDLPCMDDAMERRGKESLHRRYGEALAVLVALGLMNASYPLVFENERIEKEKAIAAHHEIVACIGTGGMVTGQAVDLAVNRNDRNGSSEDGFDFDAVRNLKTSALMRMALRVGAILSGANAQQLNTLSNFAELLGQAYQISDDVLDLTEDAALAFDERIAATAANKRGADEARRRVASHIAQAKKLLSNEFGENQPTRLLSQMADYIAARMKTDG
ncbi:MAG: polyprenyl synthetase family protein [Pyrinomonadaceae bacterium]